LEFDLRFDSNFRDSIWKSQISQLRKLTCSESRMNQRCCVIARKRNTALFSAQDCDLVLEECGSEACSFVITGADSTRHRLAAIIACWFCLMAAVHIWCED